MLVTMLIKIDQLDRCNTKQVARVPALPHAQREWVPKGANNNNDNNNKKKKKKKKENEQAAHANITRHIHFESCDSEHPCSMAKHCKIEMKERMTMMLQ